MNIMRVVCLVQGGVHAMARAGQWDIRVFEPPVGTARL
jgi:hypothetical protein